MSKNTGTRYEKIVQGIYQSFLDYDNQDESFNKISVQHNVTLTGKTGVKHQIDVYWKFELAGTEYQTIVEAKDWETPVKKEKIMSFHSLLQDIPGCSKGIFVSQSGFQSGAIEYARVHGIQLMRVSKNNPSVEYTVQINNVTTYYKNICLSSETLPANYDVLLIDGQETAHYSQEYTEAVLIDPDGQKQFLKDLIFAHAQPYYWEPEGTLTQVEVELEGKWFWVLQEKPFESIPITGFSFECFNIWKSSILKLKSDKFADFVISDIFKEERSFYNTESMRLIRPQHIRVEL